MLYLDTPWLTDLQYQLGFSTDQGYRPFNTPYTRDPGAVQRPDRSCTGRWWMSRPNSCKSKAHW